MHATTPVLLLLRHVVGPQAASPNVSGLMFLYAMPRVDQPQIQRIDRRSSRDNSQAHDRRPRRARRGQAYGRRHAWGQFCREVERIVTDGQEKTMHTEREW